MRRWGARHVAAFERTCADLLHTIRQMSDPAVDIYVGGSYAYCYRWYGKEFHCAEYLAVRAMREARSLGLYPTTEALEAETRRAAA